MRCSHCNQDLDAGASFCGNCGQPVGAPAPAPAAFAPPLGVPAYSSAAATPGPAYALPAKLFRPGGGKAIAALVLGILGLVGWLIPVIGLILGVTALALGTMTTRSAHRGFAIAGIIMAILGIALSIFAWVYNVQHITNLKGISVAATSLQAVTTPCYTTKLDGTQTVAQHNGSCSIKTTNAAGSDSYEVVAYNQPGLLPDGLPVVAQKDSQKVVAANPGSKITMQAAKQIAGSPGYVVGLSDGKGGTATLDYILHSTSGGSNLFILDRFANQGDASLNSVESNWEWK